MVAVFPENVKAWTDAQFAEFKAHAMDTVKAALKTGAEASRDLGPAYQAWAVEAVKLAIAERAGAQSYMAPESYAYVVATLIKEATGDGA